MLLAEIFQNYPTTLARENFSTFLYEEHHSISITIPIDYFEEFYLKAKELIESSRSMLRDNDLEFVIRGLEFAERGRRSGYSDVDLSANAVFMLTKVYDAENYPLPEWVPKVFFVPAKKSSKHKKEYLFIWRTVSPAHIPAAKEGVFISSVKRFARKHEIDGEKNPLKEAKDTAAPVSGTGEANAHPLSNNPDLVGLKQVLPTSPTIAQVPTASFDPRNLGDSLFVNETASPQNKELQSSLLAITLYTKLIKDCFDTNTPVTLTIADVQALIDEQDVCFYTDTPLNKEPKASISDSHLCLGRKNDQVGYSKENTVACCYKATRIIASLYGKEREQALKTIKTINSSGISMDMLMSISNL